MNEIETLNAEIAELKKSLAAEKRLREIHSRVSLAVAALAGISTEYDQYAEQASTWQMLWRAAGEQVKA